MSQHKIYLRKFLAAFAALTIALSAAPVRSAFARVPAAPVGSMQILVRQTGIFRVTYEDLQNAGLDLAGVSASSLRLTNRGKVIPIYVRGSRFGPGIYFEFYGEALDTIYTDTNVYILSVGRGRRMSQYRARARQGTFPESFPYTTTIEHQNAFASFYALGDGWYDTSMLTFTSSMMWSFPFDIAEIADPASPASIDLTVWGVTDWPAAPDHHVIVRVNSVPVAEAIFDGQTLYAIHGEIPAGTLQEGSNTLQIVLPGDTGVSWDMVSLDKFSVTYPRTFQAENGRLTFTATANAFQVTGLPTSSISVYRLDTRGPVRITNVQVQQNGPTYNAAFPGSTRSATYAVSAAESAFTPQYEPAHITTSDLNQPAEYLVISHPDFISGLQPLIQAREAEGLSVNIVDVNDIYASLSFGIFDAQAIRDYIAFAHNNLGTNMVLLVGGDTYDYRNYLGIDSVSYIPSLYADTGPYGRHVPVDPLYADVNNDNIPDLAIGRFPVRTTAELDMMVSKTLAYANKDYGRTAVYASDSQDIDSGVSFKDINLGFAATLPGGWTTTNIALDDQTLGNAQQALLDAMNQGSAIVTYMGHSDPVEWSYSGLFDTTLAQSLTNYGRPFVAVQFGCWNAYYVDPQSAYLVQSLLLSGDRGAAALLGGVTLTYSESEDLLGQELTPRMVTPGMRLGVALHNAKLALAQDHPDMLDVLIGWTLMGDPALVVEP